MLIKIADKEYSDAEIEVLAKAGVLQIGQKNDPASTSLTATPALHGPLQGNNAQFGIFSGAGVRPERFSALTRPNSWLSIVNINRSTYHNELLEIATGQTADGTTNASGFCGTPPVAGKLKVCRQQFNWGSFYGATRLNALPLLGQYKDRADMPARLLNQAAVNNPFLPDELRSLTESDQLSMELYNFGVGFERSTEVVSMRGTAATDNSRFGWFQEFAGIAGQIKTGYTDSVTSVTCPAADSVVESFNSLITGTHNDGSGRSIIATWFDLMYALKDRARQVRLNVQWAIVMRQELFRTLSEILANQYNFYQVTGAQYAERNSTGDRVQELRREMLQGNYLLDDVGNPVPVIFSEGINMPPVANQTYVTDMYVLPVVADGLPLLRLEYFPMDNDQIARFSNWGTQVQTVSSINNGMMMVGEAHTPLCKEFHFAARMRVILETPFLAARIDDIRFTYSSKTRQSLPGSSLYADGGVSAR